MSSDSYMVDVFRPVLAPGDRKLISRSTNLDESLIDHVMRGGGCVGGGVSMGRSLRDDAEELIFSIDLLVFDDGEIAGPDPDHYVSDLHFRKPAAEFHRQTGSPR
jgi:hypothetical protein